MFLCDWLGTHTSELAYRRQLYPVALFVGIGERALGDITSGALVIELGLVSAQTGFDVAQALSISQLRES